MVTLHAWQVPNYLVGIFPRYAKFRLTYMLHAEIASRAVSFKVQPEPGTKVQSDCETDSLATKHHLIGS